MQYEIRDKLLQIIKRFEAQELTIPEIYDEAEYLSEILYPDDYPRFEENDPRVFYLKILCLLESLRWIYPEEIQFIKECLDDKNTNVTSLCSKWDAYWLNRDLDEDVRYKEGLRNGFWNSISQSK